MNSSDEIIEIYLNSATADVFPSDYTSDANRLAGIGKIKFIVKFV